MKNNKPNTNVPFPSPWGKARLGLKVCGMKYEENILELTQLQPDYMGFIFYEKSPRFMNENIPDIHSSIKKTGVFVNAEPSFIQQKVEDYNLQAIQLHGNENVEYCQQLRNLFSNKKRDEIPDQARLPDGQVRDDEFPDVMLNSIQHHIKNENKNEPLKHIQGDALKKQNQLIENYPERSRGTASHQTKSNSIEIIKAFSIQDQFNFQELETYLPVVDYFLFDTKGKNPGGNGFTFDWEVLKNYPFQKPFFLSGGIGLEEVEKIKAFQEFNLPLYALDVNSKFETQPGKKNIDDLKNFKTQLL